MLILSLVTLLTTIVFFYYSKNLPFSPWSPIYIIPILYLSISLAGYLFYGSDSTDIPFFYDILNSISMLEISVRGYSLAIVAFLFGVVVKISTSPRYKKIKRLVSATQSNITKTKQEVKRFIHVPFSGLVVCILPLIFLIFGKGLNNIWTRQIYLPVENKYLLILGYVLCLPVLVRIGYVITNRSRLYLRIFGFSLFAIYELIFLTLSSRRLIVAPFFFLAGAAFAGLSRKTFIFSVFVIVLMTPFLLRLVINLRVAPDQGLLHLLSNIGYFVDGDLFKYYQLGVDAILANLTLGFPLAAVVAEQPQIPANLIFASLSPLPSFINAFGVDYYNLNQFMRLSVYMPYNTIGQLLNCGYEFVFLFFSLIGCLSAWVEVNIRYYRDIKIKQIPYLVSAVFLIVFSCFSTQYDLRSSMRIVYLSLLLPLIYPYLIQIKSMLFSKS